MVDLSASVLAGMLDEITVCLIPVLLGGGLRLIDQLGDAAPVGLECVRVVDRPGVTHLRYRVSR